MLDEVEKRRHRGAYSLPVVSGGTQRLAHAGRQILDVLGKHRQVQLELGRKVLVENGFAYTCPVGDFVHARSVIAAVDENLAGSEE
jgi:hypothetical protein